MNVGEALAWGRERLARLEDAHPGAEAEHLLAALLGRPRAWLYAWPEAPLDATVAARFQAWVARRAQGEPLAYLLGRWSFRDLDLEVGPGVLVPRPETETLVEHALAAFPAEAPVRVLDLGTGSGAIAAAIARERPGWRVLAGERSPAALAIARRNFARLARPPEARLGDWYGVLTAAERFHLILCNPPYVAAGDPHLQRGALPFEPREALVSGPRGLNDLEIVIAGAPPHLEAGGRLLVEHGWDQGAPVRALLRQAGFSEVATARDLAGIERVGMGVWP